MVEAGKLCSRPIDVGCPSRERYRDRTSAFRFFHLPKETAAITIGQTDVAHNRIEPLTSRQRDTTRYRVGSRNFVPPAMKEGLEGAPGIGMIFHKQNRTH